MKDAIQRIKVHIKNRDIVNTLKYEFYEFASKRMKFNITVKNKIDTLNVILNKRSSVIRFGDGEFDLIRGKDIPYQVYDPKLSERLRNIIIRGNYNNTIICLPDVFKAMDRYTDSAQNFFYKRFFYQNQKFLREIGRTNNWYGSTFISRPYIDLKDKSNSAYYFKKLRNVWNNKNILIVEGKYTRSGEGNDLFSNARSIKRIICPSKNCYSKIEEIEEAIVNNCKNRVVLLMLGPTAKVIVDDLSKIDNQLIDIGHIDSEYEWFKMGATQKVKLKDKHTAEFNYDKNIELPKDEKFQKEICGRIY